MITGLVARGADPFAATLGLHVKAGDHLASSIGALGFLAREILLEIPRLVAKLRDPLDAAGISWLDLPDGRDDIWYPLRADSLPMTFHFPFENTYVRLPDRFYARVAPTPVRAPRLIRVNTGLALDLGLDPGWLAGPEGVEVLAGGRVPQAAEPIAMAYAGHQFGHFVPQLGDGRAILLGEVVDQRGVRRDVQL